MFCHLFVYSLSDTCDLVQIKIHVVEELHLKYLRLIWKLVPSNPTLLLDRNNWLYDEHKFILKGLKMCGMPVAIAEYASVALNSFLMQKYLVRL